MQIYSIQYIKKIYFLLQKVPYQSLKFAFFRPAEQYSYTAGSK